jgi:hypothetical protein
MSKKKETQQEYGHCLFILAKFEDRTYIQLRDHMESDEWKQLDTHIKTNVNQIEICTKAMKEMGDRRKFNKTK